jgi:transposase
MGYKKMNAEDIYEIFRRHYAGQSNTEIKTGLGIDRKTIRQYLTALSEQGIRLGMPFPGKEALIRAINDLLPKSVRSRELYDELLLQKEPIEKLISGPAAEKIKPKTAWTLLYEQGVIHCSYETFKIFMRNERLNIKSRSQIIRIELDPGLESQIDYGTVGLLWDKKSSRKRRVHAFCLKLSHSRCLFIQFVFSQNQTSFAGSVIDGFEYFGGVTERVRIDNLKAGVIKPSLYDPQLNRTFMEVAEYYDFFIDPCRVRNPKEKGKVERIIPVARELFRFLRLRYPEAGLDELNKHALEWCSGVYGMREHGTTHEKPLEVFEAVEKAVMKKLPEQRMELSCWVQAKVHPDQFIQVEKKRYSLPPQYRGDTLWARKCGNIVEIFNQMHEKIRVYAVPVKHMAYEKNDFPEIKNEFMTGHYGDYLLKQARGIGEGAYELLKAVLIPNAYLNSRRAQGMLEIMRQYSSKQYFSFVCGKARVGNIKSPKIFKEMMEMQEHQLLLDYEGVKISEEGQSMVRSIKYYMEQEEKTNEHA